MQGKQNLFAFTLAEVLITLGIIGVVASITIPTLMQNKAKNETVAKLQKTYTILSQAVKMSEQNNGANTTWDWGNLGVFTPQKSFDTYWAPYLKVLKYCSTPADCGYNIASFKNKQGTSTMSIADSTRTTVELVDGTILLVQANGSASFIIIDINGPVNPNSYGRDVFVFVMDPIKGLMPYGYDNLSNVAGNCSTSSSCSQCATKIMIDAWRIKDDYPW